MDVSSLETHSLRQSARTTQKQKIRFLENTFLVTGSVGHDISEEVSGPRQNSHCPGKHAFDSEEAPQISKATASFLY